MWSKQDPNVPTCPTCEKWLAEARSRHTFPRINKEGAQNPATSPQETGSPVGILVGTWMGTYRSSGCCLLHSLAIIRIFDIFTHVRLKGKWYSYPQCVTSPSLLHCSFPECLTAGILAVDTQGREDENRGQIISKILIELIIDLGNYWSG